ncbi:MAG: trypsin-like peptidase domain-containing protein [Candidatus Eisenbacteria bacterium]|nr:trypsin-like peptidase domain-containing protein [Candidatus Eisenbacteria bacterium]
MTGGKRSLRTWLGRAGFVALGVACGLILSASCEWSPSGEAEDTGSLGRFVGARETASPARGGLPVPYVAAGGDFASPFTAVAERVLPAVVNVDTRRRFEHPALPGLDFFGDILPESDGPFDYPSSASGFVFDERGYVITNNHVIQDAEEILVRFIGGGEHAAEVVGVDPSTDVAVLKISGEGPFPSLPLGDSDSIRVGDWAIAVGNPFGYLEGSLTVGVVSAKGRSDLNIAGGGPTYQNFIQTDASINFGNSGGPLCNIRGEVIGVNTAVNTTGQGIGFAIPINLAARIAGQLMTDGRVVRAYIGVYPQSLTPELIEGKKLDVEGGVLIGQVAPNTPAERAGLERGDVILAFDGIPIQNLNHFRMLVADTEVGRRVRVDVDRDGERLVLDVTLAERPDVFTAEEAREEELWLGLDVIDPSEEPGAVRELGLEGIAGALVAGVEPGGPAWEAGIRAGDLIVEMNDRAVEGIEDYRAAEREARRSDKPIIFLVHRDGFTSYIGVQP